MKIKILFASIFMCIALALIFLLQSDKESRVLSLSSNGNNDLNVNSNKVVKIEQKSSQKLGFKNEKKCNFLEIEKNINSVLGLNSNFGNNNFPSINNALKARITQYISLGDYDLIYSLIDSNDVINADLIVLAYKVHNKIPSAFIYKLESSGLDFSFEHLITLANSAIEDSLLLRLMSGSNVTITLPNDSNGYSLVYELIKNQKFSAALYLLQNDYVTGFHTAGIYQLIIPPADIEKYYSAVELINHMFYLENEIPTLADAISLSKWLNINDVDTDLAAWVPKDFDSYLDLRDFSLNELYYRNESCLKLMLGTANSEDSEQVKSQFISYIDNTVASSKAPSNNNKTGNTFFAHHYKTLNRILNNLENREIDKVLTELSINFNSKVDYEQALRFVAENAVFMKYNREEIYEIKSMGGYVSPNFIFDLVLINNYQMLEALDHYDVDWKVKKNGFNALDIALSNEIDSKNIQFLLNKGLKVSH
jgi:hypothetical protein